MEVHRGRLEALCRICRQKIKDHKRKVAASKLAAEVNRMWQVSVLVSSPNVDPRFVCLKCPLICGTNKYLKGKMKTATVAKHGIIMVKDVQLVSHTCKHDEGGRQKPKKQG